MGRNARDLHERHNCFNAAEMVDVEQRLNRVSEFLERARTLADRWESDDMVSLCNDIEIMVAFCEMNLPNYALTHYISGTPPVRKDSQPSEVPQRSDVGIAGNDIHR
jgi:hypothetical protein